MKKIYVKKGCEYHSIIECIYREGLFLEDIYRRARDCTEEIVQINERLFQREKDGAYKDPCMDSSALGCADARGDTDIERLISNRFNNVIAFCAERGQGKTSAMLSYATALANLYASNSQKLKEQKEKFWEKCSARHVYYEVLRSIDPTGMEADDTILKIVLSQMFSRFQKVVESSNVLGRGYGSDKSWDRECFDLQQKFLDCFHLANLLNASDKKKPPTNMEDELEIIVETGGGVNLRIKLYQLTKKYLEFMANGFNGSKYLVITIDDADLNVGRVYEILEDIRKYFQLPRVIVLLATNIIQLESTVEQHFFEEYERSLSYSRGMVDVDRCHQISERYLEKILPGTRRLNLPNLNDAIKQQFADLRIVYLDEEERDLLNDNYSKEMIQKAEEKSDSEKEKWGYQEQLLYYLHRKTGLLFLPPEQGLHALLPDNMRGLMHFLVFFSKMEDVCADYLSIEKYIFGFGDEKPEQILEQLDQWRENLRKLEAYLLQSWSSSNLRTESRNILMELSSYSGQLMHQYLLQVLPTYYGQVQAEKTLETETPSAYQKQFLNECAMSGAYSFDLSGTSLFYSNDCYADVLTGLRVLGEFTQGSRERKFIYSIRLYYTIYLHTMLLEKLNHLVDQEDQQYYLTEFLGDGLSKERINKNGTMPFSLCSFWVPSKQIFKIIDTSNWNTQQGNAMLGTWFRLLEQKEHRTMVRHIPWDEKNSEQQIWVFNPLYYLLAEVDNLTGYEVNDEYTRKQYENSTAQKRMEFALAILLNGDVQISFREGLKAYNESTGNSELLLQKLIKAPYISSKLINKWKYLDAINNTSYTVNNEIVDFVQGLLVKMDFEFNSIGYLKCFNPYEID